VSEQHIVVVGAGIIGLACAYALIRDGVAVTIVDSDPDGDKASYGNAGGIAVTEVMPASAPGVVWRAIGWMLDPLGPIAVRPMQAPKLLPWLAAFAKAGAMDEVERISGALAAINGRVYDDLLPILEETGLSGELHRDGALSIYETPEGLRRDAAEWARKRALGILAEEISGSEAREMEPALGPLAYAAVWTPQWSRVSDPRHLAQRLAAWLRGAGVTISRGTVQDIAAPSGGTSEVRLSDGRMIVADAVVVAAGAWSGILARKLGDRVLLESERGYTMTIASPAIVVARELIFAERKFVATPLRCGLRIGGMAEFGGLHARANFERSKILATLATCYLPGLRTTDGTCWAGHRSATPDSLPVIGRSPHRANVYYAFGHGHLGLTQAATTGRLVAELVSGRPTSIDIAPFGIGRFGGAAH
jgi:D-amino-acid dehydrogenase